MRYDEMRRHVETHFRNVLQKHKERLLSEGDASGERADALRGSLSLVEDDFWLEVAKQPDAQGNDLLSQFKSGAGIGVLTAQQDELLLQEYRKGYRSVLAAALEQHATFEQYALNEKPVASSTNIPSPEASTEAEIVPYRVAVQEYLTEGQRGELWAAKTISEKRDALDLLGKITNNKPIAQLTKADARLAKAMLSKLPKNRSKNPRTRDLSLTDMLAVEGVQKVAARTVNTYVSAFQSFARWAVNNGHATENVFANTRVPIKIRDKSKQRAAFDAAQLSVMFNHLTKNPDNLVKKDDHKWPTLIAMFTGARLNEVAQLHTSDIRQHEGMWCIDINDDDGKMLKTSASRRLVPVHQQLLDAGLLRFVESRSGGPTVRLFPSFSYSAQNGYGRNVGRWFNEKFLPDLGLKQGTLVFHSLRHSMVTLLTQADVPDSRVKAIIGHGQVGVTHTSYFKSGFTFQQLKAEIDKFTF
jgi:integrase